MDMQQLIDRLRTVSVIALSDASGVSTKTIYRIRQGKASPTMRTLNRLTKHVDGIQSSSADQGRTEVMHEQPATLPKPEEDRHEH